MWGASNLPVVSTLGTVGSPPASPKTHRGQQRWWIGPPPPPRTQPWPENGRENGQKAHPSSSFIQASEDPKSSMGCKNTSFMNKDMRESVTWSVCSSLPGGRGMPMPSTADAQLGQSGQSVTKSRHSWRPSLVTRFTRDPFHICAKEATQPHQKRELVCQQKKSVVMRVRRSVTF